MVKNSSATGKLQQLCNQKELRASVSTLFLVRKGMHGPYIFLNLQRFWNLQAATYNICCRMLLDLTAFSKVKGLQHQMSYHYCQHNDAS